VGWMLELAFSKMPENKKNQTKLKRGIGLHTFLQVGISSACLDLIVIIKVNIWQQIIKQGSLRVWQQITVSDQQQDSSNTSLTCECDAKAVEVIKDTQNQTLTQSCWSNHEWDQQCCRAYNWVNTCTWWKTQRNSPHFRAWYPTSGRPTSSTNPLGANLHSDSSASNKAVAMEAKVTLVLDWDWTWSDAILPQTSAQAMRAQSGGILHFDHLN
jgi:hypothetical protein